jgi:ArsR family transcriptional regulator
MPDDDPQTLAELIKAFAHPTRLLILRELLSGPKCVTNMEDLLPARQANISQHLAVLRFARLVDYAQDGTLRCYYLARPRLVESLLELVARDHPVVKRTAEEINAEKQRAARTAPASGASSRRHRARAKT